jgi:hypothetical protein
MYQQKNGLHGRFLLVPAPIPVLPNPTGNLDIGNQGPLLSPGMIFCQPVILPACYSRNLSATASDDGTEIIDLQACAANQPTIDVGKRKDVPCIAWID